MAARVHVVPPLPPDADGEPDRRWPVREVLVGAVILVAAVAALWSGWGGERRALARLDPATRAALVAHALDDLRTACAGNGATASPSWCRERAQFALEFEECDAACRAAALEVLRVPTR